MPLNADAEHKVLPFRRIHGVHDMLDEDIVLRPSVLRSLEDVHELLARIAVETCIVKHSCPAVEITAVVMKRMRSISQRAKRRRRTLAHPVLEHRLIRVLSRPKIPQIHAGQDLELRIRRPRADGRYFEISRRIVLIHGMQIRTGILRRREEFRFRHIEV